MSNRLQIGLVICIYVEKSMYIYLCVIYGFVLMFIVIVTLVVRVYSCITCITCKYLLVYHYL